AVLVGAPMPDWSVAEILAVHFRMHKAEGVLFRDALVRAALSLDLDVREIPERELLAVAERRLAATPREVAKQMAAPRKTAGAPWGKDQKDAALAAQIALAVERPS